MRGARSRAGGATLWDLARVVREEVEKVFHDEPVVAEVSNLLVRHMIQTHVKNVRLEEDACEPAAWTERWRG